MPYDTTFIAGHELAPPTHSDTTDVRLDYTHFSLSMNINRRLARWVAWNIDGTTLFPEIPRERDFYTEDRLPIDQQTSDEVYSNNDIDRGHLARRADLLWGSYEEAKMANHDSFCFTNIAPQMNTFNQSGLGGVWGELENGVLDLDALEDRRISLFGGPVLSDDDPSYRELVQVPREYWKIVSYVVGGELRVRPFLLTQSLDKLSLSYLEDFKAYEVSLSDIEGRTGLAFSALDAGRSAVRASPSLVTRLSDVAW